MKRFLLLVGLAASGVAAAKAAVWTNAIVATPQNWNLHSNWVAPAVYPNANGAVAFLTNDLPGNQTIHLNVAITNGSLTVGDANGSHAFLLAGNGGALTFQNGGAPATLNQTPTSAGDVILANLALADSLVVSNPSPNPLTLSGTLSGPGNFTKSGPGTVVLSGASGYTGATAIQGGVLKLQGGTVLSPVAGYARWFDAATTNRVTTNAAGQVTQWKDLSANQAHAVPQTGYPPTYVPGAVNGLGAIHFGPGPNSKPTNSDSLNFTRDTTVRSVFSVFKGASFLLTDTNNYDFHRSTDTDPRSPLWVGAPNYWTSANIRNGKTYVNGAPVDGTTFAMPTNLNNGFNLVEVITAGNVVVNGFNRDRTSHCGDQWQAEVLIYDTGLSEASRLVVEQYLNHKWFGYGGNNTLPAGTDLALAGGATLDLCDTHQAVNSLSGAAGSVIDNTAAHPVRLTVNGNAISTTFAGVMNNSGGGALSLVKNGTGTLNLTGLNANSGPTLVNLGTLLASGTLGAGAVTVSANGTLAGTGTISGPVTVQSGGTLAPGGTSVGTFTLNSNLVVNSGGELAFALGSASDRLIVQGSLTLGGTVNVTDAGGLDVGTYTLISGFTALTWNAPQIGTVPSGYAAVLDTNTPGQLKLVVTLSPFRLWQEQYFADPNLSAAASDADPDGDGVSNWNEFQTGTNPTNSSSAFRLLSATKESGGLRLTWSAAGVRSNVLQAAPELYDASFNDLSGSIALPAAGDTTTNFLDAEAATNAGPRFYRVRQDPPPSLTTAQRLAWWQEARFGMFIHWDPVSLVGTEISWSRTSVGTNLYDNLYKQFNPTNFNADEWVAIAKAAGMKYIVFTTRHHDGFSMFDTQATNYMANIGTTNIYKITAPECPFGRDVVKELAAACHRAGMRFGAYYSQPDWVFTGSATDYHAYLKTQVRELLSRYGRVDVLWYDGLGKSAATYDAVNLNALARSLQPALLINNRNGGLAEDFDTPEQKVGAFQNTRAWESCMTVSAHNHWAWGGASDGVKSLATCISMLVNCAGGDGNMLLNVGPRPDGIIDPEQAGRIREMGDWLALYGESIYGTRGGPFKPGAYGACTYRTNTVYVHILSWASDPVVLPPIPARILSSRLVTGGAVSVVQNESGITLSVPSGNRQAIDTIVALELDLDASLITPVDVPTPVSLTLGANATASNVYQNQSTYAASKAVDGNTTTRWATDTGTRAAWLEVDLGSPKTFSRAVISEAYANRVTSFELQWFDGIAWQTFWTGTTLGAQWSQSFPPVTAQRVRLNILNSTDGPTIWEFQLF